MNVVNEAKLSMFSCKGFLLAHPPHPLSVIQCLKHDSTVYDWKYFRYMVWQSRLFMYHQQVYRLEQELLELISGPYRHAAPV